MNSLAPAKATVARSLTPVPSPQPPLALSLLIAVRKTLLVLVLLSLGLLGVGYWWTVEAQQQWSDNYQQLKRFNQATRDLEQVTGTLEAQVSPNHPVGLLPPRPDQIFVLPAAPQRPARPLPLDPEAVEPYIPLAY